ncbi:unnamed protein product, partial [Amoebophrya sp. A25]
VAEELSHLGQYLRNLHVVADGFAVGLLDFSGNELLSDTILEEVFKLLVSTKHSVERINVRGCKRVTSFLPLLYYCKNCKKVPVYVDYTY